MGAVINQLEVGMTMVLSVTKKWMGGEAGTDRGSGQAFAVLGRCRKGASICRVCETNQVVGKERAEGHISPDWESVVFLRNGKKSAALFKHGPQII